MERLGAFAQRDRDAPVGKAAQVVAGAVERIDDPAMAAGPAVALLRAAFLREDRVAGVGPAQLLDALLLDAAVHLPGYVHSAERSDGKEWSDSFPSPWRPYH